MKSSNYSITIAIAVLVAVFVGFSIFRNSDSEAKRVQDKFKADHPTMQLDVISQDAGSPGKIIRAEGGGKELFKYVCTPQDAAVVVFTVRNTKTQEGLYPHVASAKDENGNTYATTAHWYKGANLVSIQAGFAIKPNIIHITLDGGGEGRGYSIPVTKIAEPHRVLDDSSLSFANRKISVTAKADLNAHSISFVPTHALPENEILAPHILSTTYAPGEIDDQNATELDAAVVRNYIKDVRAVKIRLDRFKYADSETTFVFKGATVVHRNNQNFLCLDEKKRVGSLLNFDANMIQTPPLPKEGIVYRGPQSHAEVRVDLTVSHPPEVEGKIGDPPVVLNVLEVSPTLESMGLKTMHIIITSRAPSIFDHPRSLVIKELDQTFQSAKQADVTSQVSIPEFKLRIKVRRPVKLMSSTETVQVAN